MTAPRALNDHLNAIHAALVTLSASMEDQTRAISKIANVIERQETARANPSNIQLDELAAWLEHAITGAPVVDVSRTVRETITQLVMQREQQRIVTNDLRDRLTAAQQALQGSEPARRPVLRPYGPTIQDAVGSQ